MSDSELTYRCPRCGWVGTEDEMEADYFGEPSEECWSNWICPECSHWHRLEDYETIKEQ